MKNRMRYEKPVTRDLGDLTPALGLCSSGFSDGGCVNGTFAGGTQGCSVGEAATGPANDCHAGNGALFGCNSGSAVINP